MGDDARRGIQSVEVAFRLLDALRTGGASLPLREVAARAGLTRSAANNYLVSLVRTGLAVSDGTPGHYRLGPAAIALGVSAMEGLDGLAVLRREATALRDATGLGAAVTTWTADGPVSVFAQPGQARAAFELRTGLLSMTNTAAGRLFAAVLPDALTGPVFAGEPRHGTRADAPAQVAAARAELRTKGIVEVRRRDGSGYASAACPVQDGNGEVRFALSLIGSDATLDPDLAGPHVAALLAAASRASAGLGWRPPRDARRPESQTAPPAPPAAPARHRRIA